MSDKPPCSLDAYGRCAECGARSEGVCLRRDTNRFTEEALKSQDGKKVPLTLENGGPVIGEATLRYDSATGELRTDMRIDDPRVAEFLGQDASAIIFKKES